MRSELLRNQLATAITRAERRSAASAFMSAQPSVDEVRELTRSDSELRTWIRTARQGALYESRAAAEGSATTGGDLVPPGFATSVIRGIKEFDSVLNDCEDLPTDLGFTFKRPQVASFTAAGSAAAEGSQLSDGTSTLIAFSGTQSFGDTPTYSGLGIMSFQILDDSNVGLTKLLSSAIGEAIGRQAAADASTALYGAATSGQEVSIGSITPTNVAKLLAKLDPAFLPGAKLYVSQADYSSLAASDLTALRHLDDIVPVVPTHAVTDFVTTTVSGPVLANMGAAMTMRRVGKIQCQVLNERYADNLEVGVLCWFRADFASTGRTAAAVFSH